MSDEMLESTIETSSEPVDNSVEYSDEAISKAFDELDAEPTKEEKSTDAEETVEVPDENAENADNAENATQVKNEDLVDKKFLDKDGNINIENLAKSYKELEPLLNQKAEWEKEKAALAEKASKYDEIMNAQDQAAIEQGYRSNDDYVFNMDLTKREAQEYYKYIGQTDDPERVTKLLEQYAVTGDETLMKDIEIEFPTEINKRIAVLKTREQIAHEQQLNSNAQKQHFNNINSLISESVDKYQDMFKYPEIKQLFSNAVQKFGDKFTIDDTKAINDAIASVRDSLRKELLNEKATVSQNNNATDKLSKISPSSKTSPREKSYTGSLDDLSEAEMNDYIAKYI